MKIPILKIILVFLLGSATAFADIILPNQVVVGGKDAKALKTKIVEVTGVQPQTYMGRKVISASAEVTCYEYGDDQVSCTIKVQR